jgi:formyltetrahydrofolate-dependent phosphoribosylglycinamide formyltransferase
MISIPFGQFRFFKKYIRKIFARVTGNKPASSNRNRSALPGGAEIPDTTNIAIFASGAGSNAAKIISHFKNSREVKVSLVVCNKPGAGVLQVAANNDIPILMIERERFLLGDGYVEELKQHNIQWIILAGFLWKLPVSLVHAWRGHIINIHPALLPGYGGKGMYGKHVHEAVIAAGDKQSGISIHYVDEIYDHGEVIKQAYCEISENETADSLAAKIHLLEHEHFPGVIETEIARKKSP